MDGTPRRILQQSYAARETLHSLLPVRQCGHSFTHRGRHEMDLDPSPRLGHEAQIGGCDDAQLRVAPRRRPVRHDHNRLSPRGHLNSPRHHALRVRKRVGPSLRPKTSPALRRTPPNEPGTKTEALPKAIGTSSPPATATYAHIPSCGAPKESVCPARTLIAVPRSTVARSSVACKSAPVIAIVISSRARSTGPGEVHSIAAAPGAFPTTTFANCNAARSMAPESGTPRLRYPTRPRS